MRPLATATLVDRDLRVCSGDFANDGYVHAFTEDNQLLTFDPGTGMILASVNTTKHMDDCAFDYSTNTMYGVENNALYTIDITTGALTTIGTIAHGVTAHTIRSLACSYDGQLYGFLNEFLVLFSIDKSNGHCSMIGQPSGWVEVDHETAGFDHTTGTLYVATAFAGIDDFIGMVDVNTGELTMLATGVGLQWAFCVPYGYTPTPTAPESEIVWSNCLDKDMYTTVEVSVSTDTGVSPEGTSVRFINTSEPDQGYDYVVTLDDTGYYLWDEFRKGTYNYTIEKDGYTSCGNHESIDIWEPTSLECVLEEIALQARGLYVSPTGWAQWQEGLGGDTAPDSLVYTQQFLSTGSGDYVEYPINQLVELDESLNLWVVLINVSSAAYPAAHCDDMGDPNARWISTNGSEWHDLTEYNLSGTWMIRAYTTDVALVVYNILGTYLFRDGELLTETPLPRNVLNYTDAASFGEQEYSIRVVYDDLPINQGDYYAMSCPESDVVVLNVPESDSQQVNVYPNPTNDEVIVQAANMSHLRVVNTLGQTVYESDLNASETRLAMGRFGAGVYVIHITTPNGSFAQRVVVSGN